MSGYIRLLQSYQRLCIIENTQIKMRCLIGLYGKEVQDAHILCLHNFFVKFYDKIDMHSLELDLEKYASMKKILAELTINIAEKIRQRDSLRIEIDLLRQEKERHEKSIDIMQAKIMELIELLAKAITNAVASRTGNITSTIFSADSQVAQLTNMLQLSDDDDNGKKT